MMQLDEIRKQIDRIDHDIIVLLAERLALMPDVAKYKIENKISRYQPEREEKILNKKTKMGEKHNLEKEYVEDIFKRIIEESHIIQKKIMNE